jgi:phosphoribosylaminoimidazolecarboxamide formyltransferase/IMP cyclohydrolase
MARIRRALISVSDKTGIVEFAGELSKMGIEIISTGGTSKALRDASIPVTEISKYTGSPEILEGRLKTLHPKIHGGILGIRDNAGHLKEMEENGIEPIDLVVVNLYPFEKTVARADAAFEEAIENIDIGGPAMLRSAAKNHHDVAVVCDPSDYKSVLKELKDTKGELSKETKFCLAKKVFAHTAHYDCAIITYLSQFDDSLMKQTHPSVIGFVYEKIQDLRYGENPHQHAAFYRDKNSVPGPSIVNAKQIHGKELSYNNIMDADAAIEMAMEYAAEPFAVIIVKHANPCGAAVSNFSLSDAYSKALACDPVSAFGGIIAVNKPVDEPAAKAISETFFEVIVAPGFDDKARNILAQKKNIRLLLIPDIAAPAGGGGLSLRKVSGGLLLQDRDISREEVRNSKVVTKRSPTEEEWKALQFAWRICKHVKSNAIVYADSDRTLGIGAGQTSRVDSAKIAAERMRSFLQRTSHESRITSHVIVVASDAFFPFRDGVDEAAKAGATAVIQPGGSIKDNEVIAAADEHGMAMVFTGVRHFKH